MSTIKANTLTAADLNSDLILTGNGTGKVVMGSGSLSFPDADGTAGQFLKTNGSGTLSFDTLASGTDFLGELDGTDVTTVTITDLDLTPYKIVMMQLVNCDPNTTTNDAGAYLRMTISSDNGSTFISTGYYGGNGTRDVAPENVDNGAYWPICPWPGRLSNISGNVFFTGLGNASEDKVYSGSILARDTSSPFQFPIVPAGYSSSTAVIDAIKVYSTLRNIDGAIRFYGIR
jgi:hypothetical protein